MVGPRNIGKGKKDQGKRRKEGFLLPLPFHSERGKISV